MKKFTLIIIIFFFASVIIIVMFGFLYNQQQKIQAINNGNPPVALTVEEAAAHSTSDDCYLIVNNKIYDVSSYIGQHPGGKKSIIERCGQEAGKIFSAIHSNFAWNLLASYYIGDVVGAVNNSNISSAPETLKRIEDFVKKAYPQAEIINVKPKNDFYVAKIIDHNKLYEIHIDNSGKILQVEVENDELDWSIWDTDSDDILH